MNELNMPRNEDVESIDFGDHEVKIVTVTDDNRDYLIEMVMSSYLGESCKYCGRTYNTINDLMDTVYAGHHDHGRLACHACWKENN